MDGKVQSIWTIVECPYCHAPNSIIRFSVDNRVYNLSDYKHDCSECERTFEVKINIQKG